MAAAELSLLRRADLVFASSADLQARAAAIRVPAILVPNAAEYEHFAAAASQPLAEPADLARLPAPRLLWYGTLGPWVDTALLAGIARARPHWTLVLVGPAAGADLAVLAGLPNVYLLGWRPYAALPAYLRHAAVCLLPFVTSDLTRAVDPVKLYEYLAAGKPVVATPLPELAKCGDLVDVVTTPAEAVAAVERHLAAPESEARVAARLAFAAQHTWQERAVTVRDALVAALAQ
jgi:glycosyltransferase involved in cell wall biosynthesis